MTETKKRERGTGFPASRAGKSPLTVSKLSSLTVLYYCVWSTCLLQSSGYVLHPGFSFSPARIKLSTNMKSETSRAKRLRVYNKRQLNFDCNEANSEEARGEEIRSQNGDEVELKQQRQEGSEKPIAIEPPDSPDRAISIVAELKANAALFAAFAYGGLSLPGILTLTESKVTSVTTSLSTTRPIPGNDLIQAFVVLDNVTLCLMVSCVAASQLLIYRLTDGSWYDRFAENYYNGNSAATPPNNAQPPYYYDKRQSALARLVTDYRLEFAVARTTFDLGLVALLLAVGFRTIAIFDVSISLPVTVLLGGTCILLGIAYIQSFLTVFRQVKASSSKPSPWDGIETVVIPAILLAVAGASFYFGPGDNPTEAPPTPTAILDSNRFQSKLQGYSKKAGEAKLKTVQDSLSAEKSPPVVTSSKPSKEARNKHKPSNRKEKWNRESSSTKAASDAKQTATKSAPSTPPASPPSTEASAPQSPKDETTPSAMKEPGPSATSELQSTVPATSTNVVSSNASPKTESAKSPSRSEA